MGAKVWTAEQRLAIEKKGANILVSAAAGAGKTAVLVERLIERITAPDDPVSVDRILVVTFTNAAAQEMKERIGAALAARRQAESQNTYLEEQLLLLNKAAISTLHSFCLDLIRQNYYLLELPQGKALDPAFRVGNEVETSLLKLDVLEELFEEKYTLAEPLFLQLVECFGGQKDDRGLQDLLIRLYDFSRSHRDPDGWLTSVAANFRDAGGEARMALYFSSLTDCVLNGLSECLYRLQEAESLTAVPGGPAVYAGTLREEIQGLEDIMSLRGKDWQVIYSVLQEFKFGRLKACKGDVDKLIKDKVQELRNEAKDIYKGIQERYLAREPAEMIKDMQAVAPLMEYLCLLVKEFALNYLLAKLEKNLIDFSDIEHLALQLLLKEQDGNLVFTDLARQIQAHYQEVLIDEYQDINGVQEAILEAVSRKEWTQPNLFMVGDVKQSIYGFRLADPGLFLQKYHSYSDDLNERNVKIILTRNFRSRPNILAGVNYVFRQLMSERMGGLTYDEKAELVCGADFPPAGETAGTDLAIQPIEVHLVDRRQQGRENGEHLEGGAEKSILTEEEDLTALQLEARIAARRIQELLGTPVWDKNTGGYRPAGYRDMVVLLRTTKGPAEVFLEEFRCLGIPVYAEIGGGYLAAQEIRLVLSLLQIIDNPRQDLPLAAVLRSAMVGFTSAELSKIRLHRRQGDFYDALRLAARREKGELGENIRLFLNRLKYWRTFARRNSLSDLLWLLYRETGFYTYVGALPGGPQRQANLRALQDRARQYEQTALKGLFNFLRFLDKLEERQGDLGIARALGEKEDVVRIMSIHKSKGLEFPIVFVAGLGKKFNLQDLQNDVLIDKDMGLGPNIVDAEQRLKYPSLARLVVREKLKKDALAEESRILYVAMTRAKEALIMIGTTNNLVRRLARWQEVIRRQDWELPAYLALRANCFLDWLGPSLMRHQDGLVLWKMIAEKSAGENMKELDSQPWFRDPSRWKIKVWDSAGSSLTETKQGSQYTDELHAISNLEPLPAGPAAEEIERYLSWQYPGRNLAGIPAKLSVSELKNRYRQHTQDTLGQDFFSHFREFRRRPRFQQEQKGLLAAEKGSALHLVMRYLDLQRVNTLEEIIAQLDEMVAMERLTAIQREAVEPQQIYMFFKQPIGQRLLASPLIRREVPFTLALGLQELFPDIEEETEETIILQGTLDCLFEEGEGFILLDYKSDLITRESVAAFMERYRLQLDLYARAVETILRVPVREKILYSFQLGEAFSL